MRTEISRKEPIDNKGITLIALVVTIIVLLILATVGITTLMGENGMIAKAIKAKEEHIIAMEIEQIQIAYLACEMNVRGTQRVTDTALQEELRKNQNDVDTTSKETSEGYFIYVTFNDTKHIYQIDENGNVTRIEEEPVEKPEKDYKFVKQEISVRDSLATIRNPDRGYYLPVLVQLDSDNDIQRYCNEAIKQNIQILHLRVDIGQLSGNSNTSGVDKEFTQEQLDILNEMFGMIRRNELNVIIRFAYDYSRRYW